MIPDVAKRYLGKRAKPGNFEIWKPMRQVRNVKRGYVLRIQVPARFRLRWTDDEWQTMNDTNPMASTEYTSDPASRSARAASRIVIFTSLP